MHDKPESNIPPEDQQQSSLDPRLPRRLFIAFLIIGALTILSAIFIPRANLDIPWFVFALAYLAILAAALAPLLEGPEHSDEQEHGTRQGTRPARHERD